MSGNLDSDKEVPKAVPLDLARTQITTVRAVEGKSPLVVTSGSLRNMRVLTQGIPNTNPSSIGTPTILTTNLVSQAVLKTDTNRPQIASIITSSSSQSQVSGNLTRPTQITLSTTPLIAQQSTVGASYHVPRGAAVVANLAAPRSNVNTVRTPIVTAQNQHAFVRPPRTLSPAQGTVWLTNSPNGSQIKGAPTVLSSPVRGSTVKPQIIGRSQAQAVTPIRPGTILQNAITLPGQIPFKTGATGIQALGSPVSISHVLPPRSQSVVYTANTTLTPTRITVSSTVPSNRTTQSRPISQVTTRLTMPVTQARIIPPQATVFPAGTRIATIPSQSQSQPVLATTSRIITTQPNVNLGRLTATTPSVSSTNLLGQTRISTLNLQSIVAVTNTTRNIQAQGAKVIPVPAQPAQGTIHLTPLTNAIKTTTSGVTSAPRTLNVPSSILSQQRQGTVVSVPVQPQTIALTKVFPQGDGQGATNSAANVFIHTPLQSTRRSSPSPVPATCITATSNTITTTSVPTYPLDTGTYFYENTTSTYPVSRAFPSQSPAFSLSQSSQPSRTAINTHSIVTNQQMRFNPVMVVEQSRGQQGPTQFAVTHATSDQQELQQPSQQQSIPKVASSPRPSILRKRDHEGSPLKAAKNLTPVLQCMTIPTPQAPISPPLTRPDSRGNGHSSGGSTTISATSSPGIAEINEDSNHAPLNHQKEEEETKPLMEMSPRKKPRKQQLTGNDLDEHNDDMQFITENSLVKKEANDADDSDGNRSDEPKDGAPEAGQVTTVRKPASASLLNSYKQNWKATHNHYLRHSDVKPKDERRPTIMDLANQYRVQDKVNGWKIHHLSTQMEDLVSEKADQEQSVYGQLTELLKNTESEEFIRDNERDMNKIHELIKGNLQRIKIINDGMLEAKSQIMKIFDHKVHVTDIINRCASKRNFKKREKS